MADFAHRCSDFRKCRTACSLGKELLQVGVANPRPSTVTQRERYLQDNVTVALGGIEDTGTIGETALRVGESSDLQRLQVEDPYLANGLRDFLAICAHVRSEEHTSELQS